jgi:hypothetical protein
LAAIQVHAQKSIQKFEAEPLRRQGRAHQERSKNHLGSH